MNYLFTVLALLFSITAGAQQKKTDSLEQQLKGELPDTLRVVSLYNLGWEYKYQNAPLALKYALEAKQLADRLQVPRLKAEAAGKLAAIYYVAGNYDSALYHNTDALKQKLAAGDQKAVAGALNLMALIQGSKGNHQEEIATLIRALKINIAIGNKTQEASNYHNIGTAYSQLKKYERAITYLQKAYEIKKTEDNPQGLLTTLSQIGVCYSHVQQKEKAMKMYTHCLDLARRIGDRNSEAVTLNNIALLYKMDKKYEEALACFRQSLAIKEAVGDKVGVTIATNNIGLVLADQKKFEEALSMQEKSMKMAKNIGETNEVMGNYRYLANTYYKAGQYKKAFDLLKTHVLFSDTLLNVETTQKIAEVEAKFQNERKEKQLVILAQQKKLQEAELREKEMLLAESSFRQWLLIGVVVFILLTAYLLLNRYRLKQRAELQEAKTAMKEEEIAAVIAAQEEERKRFAQDLHDEVGTMMAVLKMNLSRFTPAHSEEEALHGYTLKLVDDTYTSLRNISHNIMPYSLLKYGLSKALEEYSLRISRNGTMSVNLNSHDLKSRPRAEIEISLYRIIQEILANIIKYAEAGHTSIQLLQHEGKLLVTIEDDGNGFDIRTTQTSDGIGWKNIRSRLGLMSGNIEITSQSGIKGTVVMIEVPVAA